MALYIRKAVKVGPFRFNLSKSGIGVSAGVTGLRLGTGPRGNYIHLGRGGLYYRKTLLAKPRKRPANTVSDRNDPKPRHPPANDTHDSLQEIDSGNITEMVDSTSEDLVEELNYKRKKARVWPYAAICGVLVTSYIAFNEFPTWAAYIAAAGSVVAIGAAVYRDVVSKSVVMLYDIEDQFQATYQSLHDAFGLMAKCKGRWHMEAEGRVRDKKYHAGADSLVRKKTIGLSLRNPPYVKTNVTTPSIPVGKQTLYFFPDMVMILEPNGVGAVSYNNLSIEVTSHRFVEDGTVPSDAKVVDHTWKYVNKRGGPDRRFKDNTQIPVALYEDLHFTSPTGLNERIELSKTGVAAPFAKAIQDVGATNRTYG
ncbi:DUF4236 domain-containing protein [Chromohalobacter sp. HP20-39]|uniref:DUF4236 domain-containing protein n=1 Tax=Chromohalobacter sp. HP20-39 TaxID=3079306 RepID=UPI00294B407E|nr:DUF4236 domain-containing protein [Chromohalobacter sp. HP20-39]MDV6318701.1 DUF4236 domain-containing protein [Chromohalobacter sp. HP20-39]